MNYKNYQLFSFITFASLTLLLLLAKIEAKLPSTFSWNSSPILMGPKPDSRHPKMAALKDPSVVRYNNKWHVFASIGICSGSRIVYVNFTDWSQAASAQLYFLDQSGIGYGYRAAPQIFYFEPQNLWYLVFQDGAAVYSTNPNIENPSAWTRPKIFYPEVRPQIIRNNIDNNNWVDMWVICDNANCHLFSSDDNGHLYRSQTTLANFPNGMSEPVIAMQDSNKYALWEASNVYKIKEANQYLILIEAFGPEGRYFRSWTASNIAGPYIPLAANQTNPFAAASNVKFPSGNQWTKSISHGE